VEHLPAPLATLLLVHRSVGYPLAFLIAPLALASFAGRPPHRWAGLAFAGGMTFLYLTGTTLTLTQYSWASWEFGRNLSFNLLGYLFVLHGVRAIWLWRHENAPRPTRLDETLRALLYGTVALMTALALVQNTALRAFALIAITLVLLDRADWRAGLTRGVLYRRHARYILGSYFYLLTVVSLVHLRDELATNARWLWPAAAGVLVIWIAQGANTPGNPWRARAQRWAVGATFAITIAFGSYVGWELVRDARISSPNPQPASVRTP